MTDNPFVISPRITFEVSVRLLGGLMALGYTITTILKRSSHVFSDDRVTVKIDWLEQLNSRYIQVTLYILTRAIVLFECFHMYNIVQACMCSNCLSCPLSFLTMLIIG